MKLTVLKVRIHVRVQDAKSERVNRCESVKLKVVQVPPPEPVLQEPPPWVQLHCRRPSVKQQHSPSIYNYNYNIIINYIELYICYILFSPHM